MKVVIIISIFFSKFTRDFSYSFILNVTTILVKTIFVFILPRIIGVRDFGYWQLYFLYSFFIPFGHLGLVDGIYLRNGGKFYHELDFESLRSQFLILGGLGFIWAIFIVLGANFFVYDQNKIFILTIIALDIILTLPRTLISVVFQMTGMIKQFSYSLMSESISSFLIIILMIAFGIRDFHYFILADCLARCVSLLVSIKNAPGFLSATFAKLGTSLKYAKSNISIGIYLLLSNMIGLVVVSSVRFAVESHWGLIVFSKVSLAFSISSVALTATSAASIVLFPLLKRLTIENQSQSFEALSISLLTILSLAFILYFPGVKILSWWLPKYNESLFYLTLILPMTIFDSQFLVIGSNFLKVLRKERTFFLINIIAVVITGIIISMVLYFKLPLEYLLIGLFVQSASKFIFSNWIVSKIFNRMYWYALIMGLVVSILFWGSNLLIGGWIGFFAYIVGIGLVTFLARKTVHQAINRLRN